MDNPFIKCDGQFSFPCSQLVLFRDTDHVTGTPGPVDLLKPHTRFSAPKPNDFAVRAACNILADLSYTPNSSVLLVFSFSAFTYRVRVWSRNHTSLLASSVGNDPTGGIGRTRPLEGPEKCKSGWPL